MGDVIPFPRPAARIKDSDALARARALYRTCAACGAPAGGIHHIIPRGEGGDDDVANMVALCGHGTMGCHGAHHGNPYVVHRPGLQTSFRRDAEWVNKRIGQYIRDHRCDIILYVIHKLGPTAGPDYLHRRYQIDPPPICG